MPAHVAFELGLAHGLNRPALMIAADEAVMPESLRGLTVVRISNINAIADSVPGIDRFLRHTKRLKPFEQAVSEPREPKDLTWARARLASLREEVGARRGFDFERLVAELFERAGADVATTDAAPSKGEKGVDLIVWADDLACEIRPRIADVRHLIARQGWDKRLVHRARRDCRRCGDAFCRLLSCRRCHGRRPNRSGADRSRPGVARSPKGPYPAAAPTHDRSGKGAGARD
jgi:hypothetical protein